MRFVQAGTASSIQVRAQVDEDCGWVVVRPSDVFQIVSNLCGNAVQAMPAGGELNVEAGAIDEDGRRWVQLLVSDTGSGIAEEVGPKIFDPFFTTKPVGVGTGLGLSVVRRVVEEAGGSIEFSSKAGVGTTFRVLLPVASTAPPTRSDHPVPALSGSERVLVVDDDPTIASALERALRQLGYRVTARTSANDALTTFTEKPDAFDVSILDLVMPRMSGNDLARRLRAIRPGFPVLLMSGFDPSLLLPEDRDTFPLINKPFRIEEVALAIRSACERT
ncbi:MAG: ATP-binding protein [Sandaracinaceae bacterium]